MSYPSSTYRTGPATPQASVSWTPRQGGQRSVLGSRTRLSPRPAAQVGAQASREALVNSQTILAASVGNPQASTHILRSYYQSVFEFLWRMASAELSEQNLADLCQETFSRFFLALRNEADPLARSLRPWLIDIANAAATERIRQVRQKKPRVVTAPSLPPRPKLEPWEVFSTAVDNLSPAHREVLYLRQEEGLTYAEIAQTLGVCVGTVKSRLSRGRKALDRTMKQLSE